MHLKHSPAGHLLRTAPGHLSNACPPSAPGPCDSDCSTLASAYTIAGVAALAACSACADSGLAHWDGVVQQVDATCLWVLSDVASINGKAASFSVGVQAECIDDVPNGVGLWLNPTLCRWELAITCQTSAGGYRVIWSGIKTTGATPAGAYTRQCGCDTTPTLTVS